VTVEFRLLGHVEALLDGRRLDIGHARQRCVLAALLVDVNDPVSADQLIDRVWADDTPHRARNALAAYISRLRQLLAGADVRIARQSGSYVLDTDALSVDIHRFRHIASQARVAVDPAEATALFDFLHPYIEAGCTVFNVIPCASDDETAVASVAELRRLLTSA
jgi:DNA-binding SARP family transcriptional activator